MKTPIQGQCHLNHFAEIVGAELLSDKHNAQKSDKGLKKEVGNDENNQSRSASLMVENYTSKSNWPKKVTTAPKSGRELLERS